VILNQHFRRYFINHTKGFMGNFIRDRGIDDPASVKGLQEREKITNTAVSEFEREKRGFNGFSSNPIHDHITINIPGIRAIPGRNVYPGYITMTKWVIVHMIWMMR